MGGGGGGGFCPAGILMLCHCMNFGNRERERERQRERQRGRERERERERDRERQRQRQRQRQRDRDRETERQRERETERQRETETERQRQTHTHTHTLLRGPQDRERDIKSSTSLKEGTLCDVTRSSIQSHHHCKEIAVWGRLPGVASLLEVCFVAVRCTSAVLSSRSRLHFQRSRVTIQACVGRCCRLFINCTVQSAKALTWLIR